MPQVQTLQTEVNDMILQLSNIYKNYIQGKMDVPVLKDINLEIEEGEYVAIMGPSGSGKSTLMNIIGCLDKPTSGSYMLAGEAVDGMKDRELSALRNNTIGFVFQNFNLLPRQSALQNVELPLQYAGISKRQRKGICEEALTKVGLEDRMNFKPTQLSGGQKQRVAIARALANSPKILLADEPTGALDSKSGIQVMKLFRQLHEEGVTIIMITHAREIAEHADRVLTIFDGEITSDSLHPEIAEAFSRRKLENEQNETAEDRRDAE
jgi:putative ABC transport system ATP-binding protein